MIHQAQILSEDSPQQKSLMESTSHLLTDLIIPDEKLTVVDTETTVEMNLALFKIKLTVKKSKSSDSPQ